MIADQAEQLQHFARIADNAREIRQAEALVREAADIHRDARASLAELLKQRDRLMADAIEDRPLPLFSAPTREEPRDAAPGTVEADAPELEADHLRPDRGSTAPAVEARDVPQHRDPR